MHTTTTRLLRRCERYLRNSMVFSSPLLFIAPWFLGMSIDLWPELKEFLTDATIRGKLAESLKVRTSRQCGSFTMESRVPHEKLAIVTLWMYFILLRFVILFWLFSSHDIWAWIYVLKWCNNHSPKTIETETCLSFTNSVNVSIHSYDQLNQNVCFNWISMK